MSDHLTCIGASALELAALTPFLYCVQAREQIWDLHESLCGARVTTNYVRIGGLQSDLQPGFAELCRSKVAHALELFADVDNLLTQNPIFRERMEGTGALPAATLIATA
jgi:NADH-quinone oxidoreductase subunit D